VALAAPIIPGPPGRPWSRLGGHLRAEGSRGFQSGIFCVRWRDLPYISARPSLQDKPIPRGGLHILLLADIGYIIGV
jgi:hypothetical protein